ncbi:D-amino acid dehydrogenase [Phyllobacterium salinisoli]|uniref:D-amino acid dehydrogenase n=1 Tax=Phyllobacterium salinisoli TaxID=1899321 RepID=A0A368K6W4_9HYPH|nr:D-amino acid dehydrogenase [Phyllobacterium salinisoli]RCS24954.1 D-amino acid dehydrogenase [Phyllobacterium salinisoli]
MTRIAVIGAGITGITTAYSLSRQGYDVTVFDRNRYAAMETSFANGGQLSVSNAEVWNSWSTVLKGIKWMFRKDAPLLMNPMPSWHKYSWMAEFVMNIPGYEKNTIATTRLAIEARKHLFAIAEEEKIDFDLERRGILHIYRTRQGYDHAARVNKLLAAGGLERNPVAASDIRKIEPALTGQLYGGFFTPSDSTGDIHKFTRGLADACQRRGVTIITDADVRHLTHAEDGVAVEWAEVTPEGEGAKTEKTRFDGIVVCAGVGSRKFAAQLGDRVNIYPVKGYSITINLNDRQSQEAAPWVSLLDDDAKIVTSRLGAGRMRVAGTAEFNGENRDIRYDRIKPLVDWSTNLFPGMNTSSIVPWAGLRPMMPDMLPRVGPGKRSRVFYNTGHGHLGWTLSAATAEIVAGHVASALPVEGRARPVFQIAAE